MSQTLPSLASGSTFQELNPPSVIESSRKDAPHCRKHIVGSHGRKTSPFPSTINTRSRTETLRLTSGKKEPITPAPSSQDSISNNIEEGPCTKGIVGAINQPECPNPPTPNHNAKTHPRRQARFYRYTPRRVFENRGSTARDHLASERTFLAYVRTSLALASTGVALVQLFTIADLTSRGINTPLTEASKRVQKFARPVGVTTVLLSLILLVIAVYRYFLVQNSLPENKFPVARFSVAFTTFALSSIVVVIFSALLAGRTS